jgi:hypothetical protein
MGWELPAASSGGGKKEKPPADNHVAICVAIIDMGHQEQEAKEDNRLYWAHRAYFVWELTGAKIAGTDKNHVIGADLTLTVAETGKLHKWVKARTGQAIKAGFNPLTELGGACMLNVVLSKGGHANVDGMAAVPAAFAKTVPAATYPLTAISLEEFRGGKPIPEWVPWCYGNPIEEYIKVSKEMGGQLGVSRSTLRKKPPQQAAGEPSVAGSNPNNDPVPF